VKKMMGMFFFSLLMIVNANASNKEFYSCELSEGKLSIYKESNNQTSDIANGKFYTSLSLEFKKENNVKIRANVDFGNNKVHIQRIKTAQVDGETLSSEKTLLFANMTTAYGFNLKVNDNDEDIHFDCSVSVEK
jgi:hypothetical protein